MMPTRKNNTATTATKQTRPRQSGNTRAAKEEVANIAMDGLDDTALGAEEVSTARRIAAGATLEVAAGAAHLTRAVDATIVADRLSSLSDVVGAAGVRDVAEGAELLSTSEDVEAVSAVVGLMSLGDLDRGLELG